MANSIERNQPNVRGERHEKVRNTIITRDSGTCRCNHNEGIRRKKVLAMINRKVQLTCADDIAMKDFIKRKYTCYGKQKSLNCIRR